MIDVVWQLLPVVPVGILVSLDVVVLTLMSMQRFRDGESATLWASTHAFVHALFLAIGIGIFTIAMRMLHAAFAEIAPRLEELFRRFATWLLNLASDFAHLLRPILDWIQSHLPLLPEALAILLSIGLCLLLYRSKLAKAAGEGSDDIGFSSVFKSFGARLYAASIVAMDMWYLTPTLRNVIERMDAWTKVMFIFLLFGVVFVTVKVSILKISRQISAQTKEGLVLATMLIVLLVLLEPIGVFYFAFYAAWKVVNPDTEHHVAFLIASVFFTWLLIRGKLLTIVRVQLALVRKEFRDQQPKEQQSLTLEK